MSIEYLVLSVELLEVRPAGDDGPGGGVPHVERLEGEPHRELRLRGHLSPPPRARRPLLGLHPGLPVLRPAVREHSTEKYSNLTRPRLEVILSSIYLTIQGLQLIFGLISAATFYKGT